MTDGDRSRADNTDAEAKAKFGRLRNISEFGKYKE
jgi:hypothetical protein